jgi:hypothetical protein
MPLPTIHCLELALRLDHLDLADTLMTETPQAVCTWCRRANPRVPTPLELSESGALIGAPMAQGTAMQ